MSKLLFISNFCPRKFGSKKEMPLKFFFSKVKKIFDYQITPKKNLIEYMFCKLCKTKLSNKKSYNLHLTSHIHKKNIKILQWFLYKTAEVSLKKKKDRIKIQSLSLRILKISNIIFCEKNYLFQFCKKNFYSLTISVYIFQSFLQKKKIISKKNFFSLLFLPFEKISFDFLIYILNIKNVKLCKKKKKFGQNTNVSVKINLNQ
jgi:hypothetical protein